MKIAIVKLSSLGDIIHGMIVLQFIKKHYPESEIHWIVSEKFAEILKLNSDINKIHTLFSKNEKNIFDTFTKSRKISEENFDIVIDMQGLFKSAIVTNIIGKNTWGFSFNSSREPLSSFFYKNKVKINYKENIYIRNLTLISKALGFDFSKEEILNKQPFLETEKTDSENIQNLLDKSKKNIVFIPGASTTDKTISLIKMCEIINVLDANILLTWGNSCEKNKAYKIAEKTKAKVIPKFSLYSLTELISKVDLLIGPDTGPTHIAFGLNKPSITVFKTKAKSSMKRNSFETAINKRISFKDLNKFDIKELIEIIYQLI
ncbi:MAG: lipopolysaccharide heptosyltransferase I [Candidatus Absconditabacterales bacterium]|nr:lipopolysaccharide heptosyltransferase I [Candidatus Absconditabacterales bacterium]